MNQASDDAPPRSRRERWRGPAAWTSFALAVIVTLASALTVWVKRQALDTDAWTKTSTELLQNAQVRQALSVYMVDQLYQNVDVTTALQQRLPPALDPLAAPAAAGLRQVGVNLADDILSTSAFQNVWAEANRRAHRALVSLLEGNKAGPVALVNGAAVLDLRPLVDRLRARMGVAANLPPDAGLITILRSDQVAFAQNAVKVIKKVFQNDSSRRQQRIAQARMRKARWTSGVRS